MKKLIIALVALLWSSTVIAGGYGEAGCGLGSVVFGSQKGGIQIIAATLNGCSGNQTFGMSTGTLNCSKIGLVLASRETNIFVAKNFDSLSQEMAQGNGENLNTLAALLGCDSGAFGSHSQSNYSNIFGADATPTQVLRNIGSSIEGSNLVCNPS